MRKTKWAWSQDGGINHEAKDAPRLLSHFFVIQLLFLSLCGYFSLNYLSDRPKNDHFGSNRRTADRIE